MAARWVFGYGSLVNRATHDYVATHPATLTGWHRNWVPAQSGNAVLLSISPSPGTTIDGLIAEVPEHAWPKLDERERGYEKVRLEEIEHSGPTDAAVVAYSVHKAGNGDPDILLSYLDVVVQGFYRLGGEDSVARFFETTDRWRRIRNDRAQPVYPRAQELTRVEHDLVNHHVMDLGLSVDGAKLT